MVASATPLRERSPFMESRVSLSSPLMHAALIIARKSAPGVTAVAFIGTLRKRTLSTPARRGPGASADASASASAGAGRDVRKCWLKMRVNCSAVVFTGMFPTKTVRCARSGSSSCLISASRRRFRDKRSASASVDAAGGARSSRGSARGAGVPSDDGAAAVAAAAAGAKGRGSAAGWGSSGSEGFAKAESIRTRKRGTTDPRPRMGDSDLCNEQ